MAKKKDDNQEKHVSNNVINKLASNIQNLLNRSYMSNYFNSTINRDELNDLHTGLTNAINSIVQRNTDDSGLSSLTILYNNIRKDEKDIEGGLKKIFENDANIENLINVYSENKYIKDMDDEIDTICTYMPQLEEALDILKENVLSSEQFNKEFMYMNNVSAVDSVQFRSNIEKLKNEYNLEEKVDDIYYKTAKYGEVYYYVKPYKQAFSDIFNGRNQKIEGTKKLTITENTLVYENSTSQNVELDLTKEELESISELDINISMDRDMFIREAAVERKKLKTIMDYNSKDIKDMYDDLKPDNKFETTDGLSDTSKNSKVTANSFNVRGSIVKELAREKIVPLYIGDLCAGYYYIDCDDSKLESLSKSATDLTSHIRRTTTMEELNQSSTTRDNAIRVLSKQLSDAIDVNFINSHQDFKEELYNILKYGVDHGDNLSNVKVTYIPPEDVVHFYFRKDPKTHRGISDLKKSIIPAKLYTSLYISTVLGIITRGQDKRAYYVRSTIDTNIAAVMMNTINQIKKGNFGMRDINNLNNFLNVTGRFNDMIIPEGNDGPPVRFEIMQGQDIPVKTELMEMLENMAISPTGVPLEAVQTRLQQVDFATQLTMNNSKMLKKAYKRQTKTENMFNPFLTKLYNNEFGGNDVIEMVLPAPKYQNNQQVDMTIENALNTKSKYVELAYGENREGISPEEIDIFGNTMMRIEYAGILPWDKIDKAKARAHIQYAALKDKQNEEM